MKSSNVIVRPSLSHVIEESEKVRRKGEIN